MYYAYYLSPIFAEIPTYPKIGRPLLTLLSLTILKYFTEYVKVYLREKKNQLQHQNMSGPNVEYALFMHACIDLLE